MTITRRHLLLIPKGEAITKIGPVVKAERDQKDKERIKSGINLSDDEVFDLKG